jgi:heterodisulfide reductase subunit C2
MAVDIYRPMRLGRQRSLQGDLKDVSGVDVDRCLECGKCSGGCSTGYIFDYTPRKIVQLVKLGAKDTLMRMDALSVCVSCSLCRDRCPVGIDVASMVDYFREKAHEAGIPLTRNKVSLFNELFLREVYATGKIAELPLMLRFNLGSGELLHDAALGLKLLLKGKLRLLSPVRKVADRRSVRRLFREKPAGNKA